jgi:predicted restriction endonuclease
MAKKQILNNLLLTREQFKKFVFNRDKNKCIFCDRPAVDAHHIIDRSLWKDGGYYISNGASVCEEHHWAVEKTDVSVQEVWAKCGITEPCLPPHLDPNLNYDKWGNILLNNGRRLPGEMFYLENVQKILKDKLYLFELDNN